MRGSPAPLELILASASPRRRQLLALLGLPFRVRAAAVEEAPRPGEPPRQTAARLARAKARAVAADHTAALVVGCDTLVELEGEVLGKPAHEAEARRMLGRLRGCPHHVVTGIALVGSGQEVVETVTTAVHMRDYSAAELAQYVASGDPLDKAGAYAIQHATFRPVARWVGCYANVIGLPLCHLARALALWFVRPPADVPLACQRHIRQRCTVYPQILPSPPPAAD